MLSESFSEEIIPQKNETESYPVFYQISGREALQLLAIDKSIAQLTGYTVEEFLSGKVNFFQRLHKDCKAHVATTIKSAIKKAEVYELEYRFKHKEGHYIKLKDIGKPLISENNKTTYIGELTRKSSNILYKMMDLIHAANVHGDIGVFYYIEETQKSYWSKQLLIMHGLEEAPSREDYWQMVHPEDLEYCLHHFNKLMQAHIGYKILYKIVRKNDNVTRQVISELVPVFDDEGNYIGVSGNTVDITDAMKILSKEPQILEERANINKYTEEDKILIKQNHSLVPVPVNEVVAISALRDYIQIYTKSKKTPFVIYKTLKDMFNSLPDGKFVQIHRSHVVRNSEIRKINLNSVIVDELELPLSRSFKNELKLKGNFTKK